MTLRAQIKQLRKENAELRKKNSDWANRVSESRIHREAMLKTCKLVLAFWRMQNPQPVWQWNPVLRVVYDKLVVAIHTHDVWAQRFTELGRVVRVLKKVMFRA